MQVPILQLVQGLPDLDAAVGAAQAQSGQLVTSSLQRGSPGPALARMDAEARMFIWIVILAMALVGGYWVKTRRQRKTKATYAGN